VVIPTGVAARRRADSEPALPCCHASESEQLKCIVPDKLLDTSDASTNVSLEAEDVAPLDERSDGITREGSFEDVLIYGDGEQAMVKTRTDTCWSSYGDGEQEMMIAAPVMPYQYVESWWVPMSYGTDKEALSIDAPAFFPQSWADQWVDPAMGTFDCHGSHAVETVDAAGEEWRTTVMIRNMPNNYTRDMLLDMVDSMGFGGTYDFAYLPVDFQSQAGLGYAFLNFATVADAQACFDQFEGFCDWKLPSEKVCTVTWSSPTQGLEQHIDRYRNSPVMHPSLPDEWKPVLLQQGMRVAFPPPTKSIKTPKVRQHASSKNTSA